MSKLPVENHLICYIDVLGFKEKIKTMDENEFLQIIHSAYNIAIRDIGVMSQPTHSNCQFIHKAFSDNIIICTPSINTSAVYSLFYLAYIIQQLFISKELLIRGSITKGLLFINNDYVFGSGLINAYELENEIAFYPRIVVDKNIALEEVDRQYSDKLFCIDGDGYAMIDYLRVRQNDTRFIEKHRVIIEGMLHEHKENSKVYQKICWCKEYHNKACRQNTVDCMIQI